jgi:hypothetical protein
LPEWYLNKRGQLFLPASAKEILYLFRKKLRLMRACELRDTLPKDGAAGSPEDSVGLGTPSWAFSFQRIVLFPCSHPGLGGLKAPLIMGFFIPLVRESSSSWKWQVFPWGGCLACTLERTWRWVGLDVWNVTAGGGLWGDLVRRHLRPCGLGILDLHKGQSHTKGPQLIHESDNFLWSAPFSTVGQLPQG